MHESIIRLIKQRKDKENILKLQVLYEFFSGKGIFTASPRKFYYIAMQEFLRRDAKNYSS